MLLATNYYHDSSPPKAKKLLCSRSGIIHIGSRFPFSLLLSWCISNDPKLLDRPWVPCRAESGSVQLDGPRRSSAQGFPPVSFSIECDAYLNQRFGVAHLNKDHIPDNPLSASRMTSQSCSQLILECIVSYQKHNRLFQKDLIGFPNPKHPSCQGAKQHHKASNRL